MHINITKAWHSIAYGSVKSTSYKLLYKHV